MTNTDSMWERWGRTEPYFGVLADNRFTRDKLEANRALFFESGRAQVEAMLATFEKHFGALERGSALDHGCGVGRLTLPLAGSFDEVVGVDVSQAMLTEAEANCRGAGNVHLVLADDRLSLVNRSFDFVNSAMVLQHIPVRRGERLIEELVTRVCDGGGFHLHLSLRTDPRRQRALWWASANVPGVKLAQNILAGRRWNAPAMQMNNYSLSRVVDLLARLGAHQLVCVSEAHGKFLTVSLFGRVSRGPGSSAA